MGTVKNLLQSLSVSLRPRKAHCRTCHLPLAECIAATAPAAYCVHGPRVVRQVKPDCQVGLRRKGQCGAVWRYLAP